MTEFDSSDLDEAPCGFLAFLDSGVITNVNQTLTRQLGYEDKNELADKKVETLFTLATRIFFQTHLSPMLSLQGAAHEIFLSLKAKDNASLPFMCNAVRKLRHGVYTTHCIFVAIPERHKYEEEILLARKAAETALRENTDLIRAKQELETYSIDLDRRIGNLAQVNADIVQFGKLASHDLQEPIRKIAVWADRLIAKGNDIDTTKVLTDLRSIHRECVRLRTLAADIERYISLNVNTETATEVDLATLVRQTFTNATTELHQTDTILVASPLPTIDAFPVQLGVLFQNLFATFIRFRDPHRPLKLQVEGNVEKSNLYTTIKGKYQYIDMVRILVTDNGSNPVSSREHAYLLTPKPILQSRELSEGFAISRKIVDNHYGTITAEIRDNDVTAITLILPLRQL